MDALQVVCFVVGPHRCALDILRVREIIHAGPITPLPHAPPQVLGLCELRGAYLPVVDLRQRLGVDAGAPGERYVVAQRAPDDRVALIVDRVLDVRRLPTAELQPPPALAIGGVPCVTAVAHQPDAVVLILDLDRLLA